jgi:hypothetical protein
MMRSNVPALVAALTLMTLLASGAVWAATTQNSSPPISSQQKMADKDFGKLSADGTRAFQDLTLSRLAIFDGRIDDAKKFVQEADTDFNKAKSDETVFTKAEADLKAPDRQANPQKGTVQADQTSSSADAMRKPVAWLPVDATVTIDEEYKLSPTKSAAVEDANKSLKIGDRKGAMEKLKLADIDTHIILAVVPVEKTMNEVHRALQLIDSGKYYEGSQMLKQAQDNERFDAAEIIGMPKKSADSGNSNHPAPAQNNQPMK